MPCRHLLVILLLSLSLPVAVASDSFEYQLTDIDGRVHKTSDYRGKWLVINFWASWCAPCIHEMPELERFYQQHKATAMVWGVTFEDSDRDRILEFVERLGVSYPILGLGQDPLTGYGKVRVLPTTFLINPEGLFQHRFEGPISAQDIIEEIDRQR
jgi:thiol-disulfide isomerase/thioredoxin